MGRAGEKSVTEEVGGSTREMVEDLKKIRIGKGKGVQRCCRKGRWNAEVAK